MLAQRFSRLRESPVRYAAMDPAHLRAIENYLRINTRAHGLPQLHQQGQDVLAPFYQHAAQEHGLVTGGGQPLLPELFRGGLQGDDAQIGAYLDLLHEFGQHLPTSDHSGQLPHRQLMAGLRDLLTTAHRGSFNDPISGRPRNLHTMYSQAALEHPSTRELVRNVYTRPRNPGSLRRILADAVYPTYPEIFGHGRQPFGGDTIHQQLDEGDAGGLLHLHDAIDHLLSQHDSRSGQAVRPIVGSALRHDIIPHLAENFG